MDPKTITKRYNEGDLTVIWQAEKCIHSKICWNGLPEVFNPNRRPWIDLSAAEQQAIMKQVDQCPSGALSYEYAGKESNSSETSPAFTIKVAANGPLLVQGTCTVEHADGTKEIKENAAALCRCGASSNKPYCDGSHKGIEFQG